MIPKIIHYCWFGGTPLTGLTIRCIESWKEFCPDYRIVRWDETNIDLNENLYIKEAYENKKWAFITDYVRLKVLYENGGIYMDTDVQVCKTLDQFLYESAFSGFENDHQIPTGIMAAEKGHPFFETLLSYYDGRHFIKPDGSFDLRTNVETITEIGIHNGFIPNDTQQTVCGMTFYPHDFFCPKSHVTGELTVTDNTVCIHHFDGSWKTDEEKQLIAVSQVLNAKFGKLGDIMFKTYKYAFHPKLLIRKIIKQHS